MRFTVYTSSSDHVEERYRESGRRLGTALGERGDELVYGGTAVGVMGVLSAAAREAGARVTGVIPQLMADRGIGDDACDELIVTADMSDRKQEMIARADAFVALPGGFGTLEELFEVLTWKQLGYHTKPIVLLDVDGFWRPLLDLFEHLYDGGFAKREYARLAHVADSLDELFHHVDTYAPEDLPVKWY
jgi:cytokinin riboside 5'-monophosphate phosphoribohydrolase